MCWFQLFSATIHCQMPGCRVSYSVSKKDKSDEQFLKFQVSRHTHNGTISKQMLFSFEKLCVLEHKIYYVFRMCFVSVFRIHITIRIMCFPKIYKCFLNIYKCFDHWNTYYVFWCFCVSKNSHMSFIAIRSIIYLYNFIVTFISIPLQLNCFNFIS